MTVRIVNAGIKSQTPFYKFGPTGAMTHPITKAQYDSLSINLYVWFLATMEPKWQTPRAKELNGKIYRIRCSKLKEYIDKNRHNKALIQYDFEGRPRIVIPLEELTEVGRIDEKTMLESGINGMGTSTYSTNGGSITKNYSITSTDSGKTSNKGNTGEWLMKGYFEKNEKVDYVIISEDTYGPTDITIGLKK
jgi:hypothetical protein